jgi:CHAT domain-containing protein
MLIEPIAPLLDSNTSRLVIIADGDLGQIPFAPIPLTSSDPTTPLISRYEILAAPSVSVLGLVRRRSASVASRSSRIAIFADPVYEPTDDRMPSGSASQESREIPRLPGSLVEAEAIMRLVDRDSSLFATGFDARRELVLSGALNDYRYLHFAVHGYVDQGLVRMEMSHYDNNGQKLDGTVLPQDIINLHLSADLVVLSACETSLGQGGWNGTLDTLSTAFFYAGASSVIATLWQVDDQATAEMMGLFYHGLLVDNLSPAAALRQAQFKLRQDARWRAPYYWAGFLLQGSWVLPTTEKALEVSR